MHNCIKVIFDNFSYSELRSIIITNLISYRFSFQMVWVKIQHGALHDRKSIFSGEVLLSAIC